MNLNTRTGRIIQMMIREDKNNTQNPYNFL